MNALIYLLMYQSDEAMTICFQIRFTKKKKYIIIIVVVAIIELKFKIVEFHNIPNCNNNISCGTFK